MRVWDAATGQELFRTRGHTAPVFGAAESPDGRLLASASADRTVKAAPLWTQRVAWQRLRREAEDLLGEVRP